MRTWVVAFLLICPMVGADVWAIGPGSASYPLLEGLVNINTSTDNIAGLDAARAVLARAFESLGLTSRVIELSEGHKLMAVSAPGATPRVALIGHLDTVFKAASPFQRLTVEAGKLRGPGVIDMKGGLVLIREILAQDPALLSKVLILVNDDEETGSVYSKDKMAELTQGIPDILIYEPGLPDGSVVTSESGVRWLKLSVAGRAAHAGLEPELGINACVELSSKVTRMAALTDFSRSLTVNSGVIEGGTKPNIVCDHASTTVDVRYREDRDLEAVLGDIERIRDQMTVHNLVLGADPTATLQELARVPSMSAQATQGLFGVLQQTAAAAGLSISGRHVGYSSDGNHLASRGHRVLVGLGPYGGGLHTENEFMLPESYEARLKLNLIFIHALIGQ